MSTSLHAVRRTSTLGLETPLLVPSFSSRGYPELAGMIEAIRADISDVCLVSSYDVANGHCAESFESLANIIVLDSGLFECTEALVAVDSHVPDPARRTWSREDYRRFLGSAATRLTRTNAIVVSYDTFAPLSEQVDAAREDFSTIPGAAKDFLFKPEARGAFHDDFVLQASEIGCFDILGVTERELGSSALARCRALVRLRRALSAAGLDMPIHVFGSITPAAVAAYFLCGADIFDGLNWLRASFDQAWACSPSEFAVAQRLGSMDDRDVHLELWRRNLRTLRHAQSVMRRHAAGGDVGAFAESLPFAQASVELSLAARAAESV